MFTLVFLKKYLNLARHVANLLEKTADGLGFMDFMVEWIGLMRYLKFYLNLEFYNNGWIKIFSF